MVVGKGQTKQSLFQSGESIQEKGTKLPMHNFRFQTSSKKGVTASVHVTGSTKLQTSEEKVSPTGHKNQFLEEQQLQKEHDIHDLPNCKQKKQAIHIDDETKTDNHKVANDLVDQEEIGGDECAIDEEIGIDCGTKGILELKKVRGKTTCKDIHARNLEERKKVTFDKGQAVGPTGKIVSELTNFIGTISRNSRFINLMYTSWHAVPKDKKKRMWEYINAMCEMNSRNRKKQKWRHRMGPINFARVHVALRATKENNEEPSKSEMFIATRTKTGNDLHTDTQVAIAEFQNRQNSGETTDDALRCYGRSMTTSSLKKDEETNELKQKHANEITSLKEEMNEMREEMRHFFSQLLQNNPRLNVRDMLGCVRSNIASPIDVSSAQAVKGQNLPHSSGSTHDPVLQKFFSPLVADLCVVVAPAGSPCLVVIIGVARPIGQKLKGCGLTFQALSNTFIDLLRRIHFFSLL
ncbi:hypothetical protein KY290_036506 [Solanum tuberosum]|uniref:Integrase core domain containing protein n=1 Tax=Solanum tuberosum TaxID=4113 RepID=A0ABQ7TSW9_SOLTU|nr:hypothetical protein KY285_035811 [Solanum tuberosum]KAH0737801.1 hypothetical protein KY290_036506 [Solanum tuberosum]